MTDYTAEDLPAPWPDVLDALRSVTNANGEVFRLVEMIRDRHDADIAELRDEIRALREDTRPQHRATVGARRC